MKNNCVKKQISKIKCLILRRFRYNLMFRITKIVSLILFLLLIKLIISTKAESHSQAVMFGSNYSATYFKQTECLPISKSTTHLLDENIALLFQATHSFTDYSNKVRNHSQYRLNNYKSKFCLKRKNNKLKKKIDSHRIYNTTYYIYMLEHILI